uniref:Uncharacterized protein n=1 Tax=Oryza sativa subsp. japonica TaxID=39947 RepID=Q69LK1_ORYSJ|nr:hypothetical protein [Oryza sativa Japonica Group]
MCAAAAAAEFTGAATATTISQKKKSLSLARAAAPPAATATRVANVSSIYSGGQADAGLFGELEILRSSWLEVSF